MGFVKSTKEINISIGTKEVKHRGMYTSPLDLVVCACFQTTKHTLCGNIYNQKKMKEFDIEGKWNLSYGKSICELCQDLSPSHVYKIF